MPGYTDVHRRSDGASSLNTDLTDVEWALVGDLSEHGGQRRTPPRYERRAVVNAPEPTAVTIDAQSTRSTAQGGNTGFDASKKVKGRKHHPVVDTLGLLLAVTITPASVQDRDAAAAVVAKACVKAPGLKKLYTDSFYGGQCVLAIEKTHGIAVEVVRHPNNQATGTWQDVPQPLWPDVVPKGFVVQARCWVVERTHSWNERCRRLIAHHDRSDWAPVTWVWLAEARMSATRLAAQNISFTPSP